MAEPRLDLDAYLDYMRRDGDTILHLGCRLTAAGAQLAIDKLAALKQEIESGT